MNPFENSKSAFMRKHSFINTTIDDIHFSFLNDVENSIRRIRFAEEKLNNYNDEQAPVSLLIYEHGK